MSTTIALTDLDAALERAADTLTGGSIVVLPVGGVYAVVADAFRPTATQRIFAARRRSRVTPLPVLIRSERQVAGLAGEVPEPADRLMAAFWPGDLTLVLKAGEGMTWDLGTSHGTVQLRQPAEDFVLRLIGIVGPLACTAANRLDQPRPLTVEDARQQLGVLVPVYLDGGERDGSVSTIVDVTGPSVVVSRPGVIPEHHIHLVAGGELPWGQRPQAEDPAAAPPLAATDDAAAVAEEEGVTEAAEAAAVAEEEGVTEDEEEGVTEDEEEARGQSPSSAAE